MYFFLITILLIDYFNNNNLSFKLVNTIYSVMNSKIEQSIFICKPNLKIIYKSFRKFCRHIFGNLANNFQLFSTNFQKLIPHLTNNFKLFS